MKSAMVVTSLFGGEKLSSSQFQKQETFSQILLITLQQHSQVLPVKRLSGWYIPGESGILSIMPFSQSIRVVFRKHRSTTDRLIKLETIIKEGFIKRQHTVGIFLDLEKTYDTTWKYGFI